MNRKNNEKLKNFQKSIPRIFGIIYVFFISIFAFDTNGPIGLLIQLIPAITVAIVLAYSWKYEKKGGILFLILSLAFTVLFNTYRNLSTFVFISLPLITIGSMFLVN